jgi:Na+-translocating ferredoxin:NAD+ oxidoreductase RNF subunit RnfB
MTFLAVSLAAGTLLLLAIVTSVLLGWASQAFYVEIDPRIEKILAGLPGTNCGGCGYVGCSEYAEAVANGEAAMDLCGPGGASAVEAIAEIMGVEANQTWPYRVVVHCAATLEQRLGRNEYRGEPTCAGANLVAGFQGCVYGCLGLGDCVDVCDFDALHIVDGLAIVDYEKCTGCGACVDACPRGIITRVPFKTERILVVACSNQDFGNDVRKVCEVGCIGCKACARDSQQLTMIDNLPVIDYESDEYVTADFTASLEKCPMECLLYVGKPRPEDIEATISQELPDRVVADFQTTVDSAEWRG